MTRPHWSWHLAALAVFAFGALFHCAEWFRGDSMPPGDFPGYAAQVQWVRDALLEYGRVPRWCAECYGGTAVFTSQLKERLVFPLAALGDPILATKLGWIFFRVAGAALVYTWVVRSWQEPAVGILAGFAYAFGAVANGQSQFLDAALSSALLPLVWITTLEHFRTGGWAWAVALGAAVAALFLNTWVHAFVAPFAALLVLAVRPWPGRQLAAGWPARSAVALLVFFALAASQLGWLVADAPHHQLVPEALLERAQARWSERSPILYLNRGDWLGGWLQSHQPPGFDVASQDQGRRYLGVVLLAVAGLGWLAAPRASALRLVAACAAALFCFQTWLAHGPLTLVWEIATSFGLGPEVQGRLVFGLRLAALVAVLAAAASFALRHGGSRFAPGPGGLLALALLLSFPTFSLWSALSFLPMFEVQRSPVHFFDTAHFWLALAFAASLVAVMQRAQSPALRRGLVVAVFAALLLDFAPSRSHFSEGEPMAPLREAAALLAALEGEGGSVRAVTPFRHTQSASWLLEQSSLGVAWGWLNWQAGRHWPDAVRNAAFGGARLGSDGRVHFSPDSEALAALRIRYFLMKRDEVSLPAPWEVAGSAGDYSLWRQPGIEPMARGQRTGAGSGSTGRFVVDYQRPHPERIVLDFDAGEAPGWIALSESHHPWWRARSGGRELPVVLAPPSRMTLAVPPGPGRVEMRFAPPLIVSLLDGLSALAWLALAAAGAGRAVQRVRRARR